MASAAFVKQAPEWIMGERCHMCRQEFSRLRGYFRVSLLVLVAASPLSSALSHCLLMLKFSSVCVCVCARVCMCGSVYVDEQSLIMYRMVQLEKE